jgi:hypothetical protein
MSDKNSKTAISALFGVLGIILFLVLNWSPLILIGLGLGVFYYFTNIPALQKQLEIDSKEVNTYKFEIDHLLSQVPSKLISDQEMINILENAVRRIEKIAISELALSPNDLLQLESKINPLNISSIHIMQWGTIQPPKIVGKDRLPENHRIAFFVTNGGLPLFGVYYFQYIFLTKLNISVYSCFYDLILDKTFGDSTSQYYYKDIVSIGSTNLVIANPYDESEEYDTTTLQIAVSNNNPLQIAITDERILTDLNDRIKIRKEILAKEQKEISSDSNGGDFLNINDSIDMISNINTDEEGLPSTRARAAMAYVRREWARLKGGEDH